MRRMIYLSLIFTLLAGAVGTGYAESGRGEFFPMAGFDLVHHELQVGIFEIKDDGADGRQLETLKFQGRMLLERGDPFTNGEGFRQINFLVKEWEAFAWSDVLETMVTYRLTEGVEQDFSTITAQQKGNDYPAKFDFAVNFTSTVFGNETILPHGNPEEEGFFEVPPSGNRRTSPTLYGFETERIEFAHPEHGQLRFVPLECNDSSGETLKVLAKDSPARDSRLLGS